VGGMDTSIMGGPGDEQPGEVSLRLEEILHEAPASGVTIDWLLEHLFIRSPEILFLLFTPVAIVPATSPFAGALFLVAAIPLIAHRRGFLVPQFLAARQIPAARLERAFGGVLPVLKWYEAYAISHPHPPAKHHTRLVGILVTMLSVVLLLPLPFSNVLPGFAIGTVALAALEQNDKLLILASLLSAVALLAVFLEALSAFHLAAAIL
jgi:hypothetical protein